MPALGSLNLIRKSPLAIPIRILHRVQPINQTWVSSFLSPYTTTPHSDASRSTSIMRPLVTTHPNNPSPGRTPQLRWWMHPFLTRAQAE